MSDTGMVEPSPTTRAPVAERVVWASSSGSNSSPSKRAKCSVWSPPVVSISRAVRYRPSNMRGHAPNAPYHSIIAAAVGDEPASTWLDQLAIGGRLIAPVRVGESQVLAVVDREATGYKRLDLEPVHFVPLKSGVD